MFRLKKIPIAIAVICVLALVVSACGSGGSKESKEAASQGKADKKIRIGVAMKTEVQPRWKFDLKYMEEEAKSLNAELVVQYANDDVTKQGNQVENLLSQGIDVLVIVPVNDKTGPFVQKAKDAGVPVIAYDALPQNADVDLFVTRDNYKVGELQANAALKYIGDQGGNIAILKGDPASTVAQGIATAYDKILKNNPKVHIVAEQWHENWSTEKGLKTAENALSAQNDNIKAFVSSSDGLAMGVAQAVKGRNLQGKVFISGLDVELGSARLIAEGVQSMSVWTKIDEAAKDTIDAAVKLAKGEKPESESVTNNGKNDVPTKLVDVVAVDKDNLCQFITEIAPPGWMSAEQVYQNGSIPAACEAK